MKQLILLATLLYLFLPLTFSPSGYGSINGDLKEDLEKGRFECTKRCCKVCCSEDSLNRCQAMPKQFVYNKACEGSVPGCSGIGKFQVWVLAAGVTLLGTATYFCLQKLKCYDPDNDDGSGMP